MSVPRSACSAVKPKAANTATEASAWARKSNASRRRESASRPSAQRLAQLTEAPLEQRPRSNSRISFACTAVVSIQW